jgi:hypothetical protein
MAVRLVRVALIALAFFVVFSLSQQATAARHQGETIANLHWAVGALAILFLIGAWANERARVPVDATRKDLLWGLGVGGIAIVVGHS